VLADSLEILEDSSALVSIAEGSCTRHLETNFGSVKVGDYRVVFSVLLDGIVFDQSSDHAGNKTIERFSEIPRSLRASLIENFKSLNEIQTICLKFKEKSIELSVFRCSMVQLRLTCINK
jgi:hypothetical protein